MRDDFRYIKSRSWWNTSFYGKIHRNFFRSSTVHYTVMDMRNLLQLFARLSTISLPGLTKYLTTQKFFTANDAVETMVLNWITWQLCLLSSHRSFESSLIILYGNAEDYVEKFIKFQTSRSVYTFSTHTLNAFSKN